MMHGQGRGQHHAGFNHGRRGRNQEEPRFPMPKMDFPKFNGKRPKEWVYKAEQYFICQEIAEQHKIRLAKMYLEEEAMKWYCFWEEDFPNATWDVFKEELLLHFGDTTHVNHEIELRNLKQTSTVQDYQTKFERLSSMVKNRPVESKIAHFIGGLSEDIQIEMLRDPPTELRKCFDLAKVIEEQFKRRDARKKAYKPGFVSKPNTNFVKTAPPKKPIENKPAFRNNIPIKKVPPGHRCKHFQLYEVVESDEEIEVSEDTEGTEVAKVEDEIEIKEEGLCHTLTNNGLNAMKVVGKINNQKVIVLLDTGATHNFLNSRLAHLVEGKVTPQASFNVMVGNGEKLTCNEVYKDVSLEMHKTPFKVNLYLIPIGGVDVVLGIQWMKPLKRTMLDWENMMMTFPKEGGGEITLEAINPSVGAATEVGEISREANFQSFPTTSKEESGFICCEVNSSTKAESELGPRRDCVENLREAKGTSCMEDLGGFDLGDLDPPGLGVEGLGAPSLEEEDPDPLSPEEEDLGTLGLGDGGLGLEKMTYNILKFQPDRSRAHWSNLPRKSAVSAAAAQSQSAAKPPLADAVSGDSGRVSRRALYRWIYN
ncbi:hypothetical protein EJ110_NYTH31993 [Nymphaea thermarum]|nr:hypothetical protein EJ110_NYTH31993 [Nymphaea thermarum]